MKKYSQTTITNVIKIIIHINITINKITQQIFTQKITKIHIYTNQINIIYILKKNQSLLKKPLKIIYLIKLNLLKYIFLHFNNFNLYSFYPLISLII